jgi:hypothetical protein
MSKEMLTKTYSIMGLVSQLRSGQLNRDAEMQRSYVWGKKEQTEFIDSILQIETTYIPSLIGAESEKEIEIKGKMERIIDLLDGKQRGTTLEKFVNDEITLGYNIRPVVIRQEDDTEKTYIVSGLKWSEFPEEVKMLFKVIKIQMVYFKNMNSEARDLQFIKLQGGKKLSNAEINKVRIGATVRGFIYKQLATDLWTKYAKISSNREVKFETMQQVLMIMSSKCDLSGKSLQTFSEDSEMIEDDTDMLEQVEQTTDYLNEVVKLIKKCSLPIELQSLEESEIIEQLESKQLKKYLKPVEYLKKVHVPIIYNVASKAINNNIEVKQFSEFLNKFFLDIPFAYHSKMGDGSASITNVKARIESMTKSFMDYFKIKEQIQNQVELTPEEQEIANNIYSIVNQEKVS